MKISIIEKYHQPASGISPRARKSKLKNNEKRALIETWASAAASLNEKHQHRKAAKAEEGIMWTASRAEKRKKDGGEKKESVNNRWRGQITSGDVACRGIWAWRRRAW